MVAPFRRDFSAKLALVICFACFSITRSEAAQLRKVSEQFSNLYSFDDTCNVYVLTAGERAILIDFGSGDVLEHLPKIGVKQIDWVLFTIIIIASSVKESAACSET